MNKIKLFFDFIVSFVGLLATWWIILIAWIIATIETKSNGFFVQKRVGKNGKLFNVYKIKTMKKINGIDTTITSSNDVRITKSGKFFRDTKVDELPQLFNILIGDMSFVGPRPDVEGYADKLQGDDRIILSIKPGITGPASLKYKDEEDILSKKINPKEYNDRIIWPDKVKINKEYLKNWTLKKDIMYIIKTVVG
jgi:lipopolysaccharide/colanic/teichoic acid biosynthesis glycosyltransferase